ncbi:MAG TPA: DUF3048 domain-containing protein [Actinomycetota bacterium]|nr:DUF3048 domain-containing protein [Actinomycetota bacterium]
MNNPVNDLVALILALAGLSTGVVPGLPMAPPPSAEQHISPPAITCPLTGVDAAGADLTRPTHAVKIDNAPRARPQVGMPQADVVYEELVEGGLTRFLVVFHCQHAPRLGPIRSARLVDPDLLIPYAPVLLGYSGAAPPVTAKVRSTNGVINLVHGANGPAYQRSGSRPAPHNLYTSSDALLARPAAQGIKGPPSTGYTFDPGLLAGPPTPGGSGVNLSYSRSSSVGYSYDPGSQKYLRSQGGRPHNDESGAQLSATNVLVFRVPVQIVGGTPHIGVTGEGEATVLRGGQAVQGKWVRPSLGDHFKLVDGGGQPISLAPGNIWINLVPTNGSVALR